MRHVTVNDAKFSTRAAGLDDGPGCLLIHGLNANQAFWHPHLVRELGAERRLVMYDQRGHGHSDLTPAGYTTAGLAADAVGILDAYDLPQVDVVAHSFGTGVALQLARLHPQRIRSLVVLDGRSHLLQPELRLGEWQLFERWQAHFAAAGVTIPGELDLDFTLPVFLQEMGIGFDAVRERLAADGFFVPSRNQRSAEKYRKLIRETAAPGEFKDPAGMTVEAIRELRLPLCLIYGTHSPYLPTRDALLRALPGSQSHWMEGAGHNFPFLRAAETARLVLNFWNTPASAPQDAAPTATPLATR